MTDRRGVPLASLVTGANRHESAMMQTLVDAVPRITQPSGQRRNRPDKLHADKGSDVPRCRRCLHRRQIQVRIARIGVEAKGRLGCHRWVIERTFAWLHRNRRLQVRYERRQDIHEAFLTLACALQCLRAVERFC